MAITAVVPAAKSRASRSRRCIPRLPRSLVLAGVVAGGCGGGCAQPVAHAADCFELLDPEWPVNLAAQVEHVLVDDVGDSVGAKSRTCSWMRVRVRTWPGWRRNSSSSANSLTDSVSSVSPRQAWRVAGSNRRRPTARVAGRSPPRPVRVTEIPAIS